MNMLNLTKNTQTKICDCHYDEVNRFKWSLSGTGYAVRSKGEYLHRRIMKANKGQEVDHINGDKLDNRCSNLRLCTRKENSYNQPTRKDNKSGYRGVIYMPYKGRKKCWKAYIGQNNKQVTIGYYLTFDEAVEARKTKAAELFGEFAYL